MSVTVADIMKLPSMRRAEVLRSVLPFEKAATWYWPPEEAGEYVIGDGEDGDDGIDIRSVGTLPFSREVMERGIGYYNADKVVYMELDGERGRAIVLGTLLLE